MKTFLQKLLRDRHLSEQDTYEVFELLMQPENETIHDSLIGAFLFSTALELPTADELVGAARSLRNHMLRVQLPAKFLIDTCGTGGSGLDTFNTSTAVSLLLASMGIDVCKHGNRAASSRCGSADVLEALGVPISLSPAQELEMFKQHHFCFLFAPSHHPATKRVQSVRKQLGVRTIFNFLGPLVNPASPSYQLLGTSSPDMLERLAQTLQRLGVVKALVVCGEDGLDEISLCAHTRVAEVSAKGIRYYAVSPEDFGLARAIHSDIAGNTPQESAQDLLSVLEGAPSRKSDLVAFNAGAALYICGAVKSIKHGISDAQNALRSGGGATLIKALRSVS